MTIHLQHLRLQISCIVRPVSAVHQFIPYSGNGEAIRPLRSAQIWWRIREYPLLSWHTAGIRRGRQPPDADEAGALRTPLPGRERYNERRSCIILLRRDWSFMKCTGLMTRKIFGKFISYLEQRFTKSRLSLHFKSCRPTAIIICRWMSLSSQLYKYLKTEASFWMLLFVLS